MPSCQCGLSFSTGFSLDLHRDRCDAWREGGIPDPDGTQTCKSCFVRKDLNTECFNKHPSRKCGFDSRCKACTSSRAKNYLVSHKEEISEQRKTYYETNRETLLEKKLDSYYQNRDVLLAKKKIYTAKNSKKLNAYVKSYQAQHKDELRAKAYSVRSFIINEILEYLGAKCEACGIEDREFLTVDHIDNDGREERYLSSVGWKRKILQGRSDPSKYRVLCHSCNLSRYRQNPIHHLRSSEKTNKFRICPSCKTSMDTSLFGESTKAFECKQCVRLRKARIRKDCFAMFDSVCQCCKERDGHKLSLDHIHMDGAARRMKGERTGVDIYRKVLKEIIPTSDFQLLCFNCNYSSYIGKGVCFHKRKSIPLTPATSNLSGRKTKTNLTSLPLIDFELSDILIEPISSESATQFLGEYHYGGFGRGAHSVYGVKLGDDLIAVVKFASVVRLEVASSIGYEPSSILELDRFCIHPARHKKNLATYVMSRVLKQLRVSNPDLLGVVSFADPRFGHSGFIYKASNWMMLGLTTSSYHYIDKDGGEINKKTLYNSAHSRHLKEREYADSLHLQRISTPPKIKYLYKFN